MPSVHVLWAVVIGWYVWRVGRGAWRALGPAHAVITILVVVATGNHWWLDGIVAVAVPVVCAGLRGLLARRRTGHNAHASASESLSGSQQSFKNLQLQATRPVLRSRAA
jgi:hypothetical protein